MRKALLLTGFVALFASVPGARAAVIDPSFTESLVATGVADVTSIEWAPDGTERLFFLRKSGEIRIIDGGVVLPTPFATVTPLATTGEDGLLGIAFDPAFIDNHYLYVFATVSSSEQQILRYTANGNLGENPTVIVAGLPSGGKNHNGGALAFGPDGKLYWAIGDNGTRTGVKKDLVSFAAKVSRANPDGSAPADNPYNDGKGPNNDFIWASGFRNPFRMTFQPATGRLWLDVVGASYEQVFMPQAGDNGGWDSYEANQPAGFIEPVISYGTNIASVHPIADATRKSGIVTFTTSEPHRFQRGAKVTITNVTDASFDQTAYVTDVSSPTQFSVQQAGPNASSSAGTASSQNMGGCVTGGTFWDSSAVPGDYRGNFFFTDYNTGRVFRAKLDEQNRVVSVDEWANTLPHVLHMAIGPDGDLYYAQLSGNVHHASFDFGAKLALVVSRLNVRLSEGGHAAFNVRLSAAPAADRMVTVARSSGDEDVQVEGGAALVFTAKDWNVPQTVLLASRLDADTADDLAELSVSSTGLTDELVTVRVTDDGLSLTGAGGAGTAGSPSENAAGSPSEATGGAAESAAGAGTSQAGQSSGGVPPKGEPQAGENAAGGAGESASQTDSGCGCEVAGGPSAWPAWLFIGLGLGALSRRRRGGEPR